uniref:S9 family peptidase n=1 Tax=Phenylobacterium glaciei TaxID=2803784 RepID=A0A974P3E1_9CAUL|nr:S9 family peptidase [Phenylobacterium glaciei]
MLIQRVEEGHYVFKPVSLKTGKEGEALALKNGVLKFLFDGVTRRIIGVVENDDANTMTFFTPEDQANWNKIKRAFPGERVTRESWSDNRKQVVVKVQGPKTGAAYMFVDLAAGRASMVDDMQAGLGPDEISTTSMTTYKAGDGLEIPAVLTLPKGRDPKNLPLVVMPHGGPQSFDTIDFDWWRQALASRGYVVLQPNFRGSDGYGPAFTAAGYGEWGRKMQTDLSDGVKHLAAQGSLIPSGCVSWAPATAAMRPWRGGPGARRLPLRRGGFRDLQPPSFPDVEARQSGRWPQRHPALLASFHGRGGRRRERSGRLFPALQVAKIKAPVLLIHGKDDLVVPYEQSQFMADALVAAGKSVELVTLAAEDHWLSRGATRTQMLQATVSFLERPIRRTS